MQTVNIIQPFEVVTNVHHPNRFAHRERIWYDYACPHQKKKKHDTNDVATGYFFRKLIMIDIRDLVDRYGISVSQMTTDMFHKS
jgi:hypothetical protein